MEDEQFRSYSNSNNDDPTNVSNANISISMDMDNGGDIPPQRRTTLWGNWFRFRNESHRRNFVMSVCVYFSFISLGWTYGQLGTAFPDLQLILKAGVKKTSLLFTMNSIGYITGSFVIGATYDRVNKLLLLSIVSMLMAITSIALPYCTRFWLFLAVRLIGGISCGGLDSGGNAKVASSWGTEGRQYMQALHFSYAIGGIIAPLVTSPFLAPRLPSIASNITESHVEISKNYTTMSGTDKEMDIHRTVLATEQYDSDHNSEVILYEETRVHYAFLITGVLCFISSSMYFALYMKGYTNTPPYTKRSGAKSQEPVEVNNKRMHLSWYHVVLFLMVLGSMIVVYGAIECKIQSFLMPFVIMQLGWRKQNGAILVSLLWAMFGTGRFIAIFISRYLQPTTLILLFMSLNILSTLGVLIGGLLTLDILIWLFIPLSGLMMSLLFPTFIVWTGENVLRISGKMAAFFMCTGSLGFMIDPLYIGKLMEQYTPMYFAYVQVGETLLCLALFCTMYLGVRHFRTHVYNSK